MFPFPVARLWEAMHALDIGNPVGNALFDQIALARTLELETLILTATQASLILQTERAIANRRRAAVPGPSESFAVEIERQSVPKEMMPE